MELIKKKNVDHRVYIEYDCNNKKILNQKKYWDHVTHHTYSKTRTRNERITMNIRWTRIGPIPIPIPVIQVVWGPWSIWTVTNSAKVSDKQALASATPPRKPWCPDVAIKCP